jgi:uncharacterized protein YlxW (UPF0749 family)
MTEQKPTAPDPEEPPPSGRARLLAALRRPWSRGQVTAAVLLAVVGFASVVQVRANEGSDRYVGMRQGDLIQLLNSLSTASQRAENEIAKLQQTRNTLRNDTDSRRAALERARQQANTLGILAGTLPAEGPGVRVSITDPNGKVGTDLMLNGIEELRDAGAEVIEINDSVRVIAQTSFKDGLRGIIVDGHQLSPPYTIDAIGSPRTLAPALAFTGGFIDEIESPAIGGKVVVTQSQSVEIASVRQPAQADYARPTNSE